MSHFFAEERSETMNPSYINEVYRVPGGSSGDTIPNCWVNSGKSGRERALRLMAIRQASGATGVERLRPRENV